jgi:hypothetical protein
VPAPKSEDDPGTASPARAALPVLADALTGHGFDLRSPVWEQACSLDLTNVRGSMCEITLTDRGASIWEYRPFHGTPAGPGQIVDMVMTILAAYPALRGLPVEQPPGLAFKGIVGKALTQRGLAVALKVISTDEADYEVYAAIEVTNPARPALGTVQVTDDHAIRWECLLAGTGALTPQEIANTIATTLTGGR